MSLLALSGTNSVSGGYDIDNSCKFEADNSEYLSKTPSSAGNQKTWTFSAWVKRTELGETTSKSAMIFGSGDTYLHFIATDKLVANLRTGGTNFFYYSERVFRDTSSWYHFVLACDTTQSTASNRLKLYVNGVYESPTESNGYTNIAQNADTGINSTNEHEIGKYTLDETTYAEFFSGYMAEMHLVDGTALDATSFGEFDEDSGIWKPKAYTGTYGTNGFYLDFADGSDLGDDESGNGNDFTETNITSADQATDTPTNNFATLNPLHYTTKYTITEGATNQVSSADGWGASVGSIGVTSGKWYFEVQSADTNGYTLLGVIDEDSVIGTYVNGDAHAGDAPYGIAYYGGNGSIITNGSAVSGVSFASWTTETMGCALDLDNNKIYFSKSGTYGNSGDPASGSNGVSLPTGGSGTWFISTSTYYAASPAKTNQGGYTTMSISSAASDANGYGTFEYAPPSGYYALCTKNLAEYG
tara:strand:- start:4 stop:1419 length:1416 start_codon:yes stop_codon:yes gene_type:complete